MKLLKRGRLPDLTIFVLVLLLLVIGMLMVYSSSHVWAEYKYGDPYYLLKRRYNEADFSYEYVDMDEEPTSETHRQMIDKMEEEDMFYPLVLLNGKIIAEGIPNPKEIFKAIESLA